MNNVLSDFTPGDFEIAIASVNGHISQLEQQLLYNKSLLAWLLDCQSKSNKPE